ncbi:Uncharacterized protein TCM_036976 [Theobroma cacao]|uniref:Uncharacterized protein n=1 Tax=Theobroma cacao TaxID=3641 RepID=A0A061GQM4_THECC|nr:Uncharacterized protein TCM_036976 [Theobroma cacao]
MVWFGQMGVTPSPRESTSWAQSGYTVQRYVMGSERLCNSKPLSPPPPSPPPHVALISVIPEDALLSKLQRIQQNTSSLPRHTPFASAFAPFVPLKLQLHFPIRENEI